MVGLISTLPLEGDMMAAMRGRPMVPMAIIEQLQQLYTVKHAVHRTSTAIPPDVDVLMLVHPQQLSDKTLYAIDQFVLKGGKALVFVDPHSETAGSSHPSQLNPPGTPTASDLDKLFTAWGFEMAPKMVAGDRRDARARSMPGSRGGRGRSTTSPGSRSRPTNLNRDRHRSPPI